MTSIFVACCHETDYHSGQKLMQCSPLNPLSAVTTASNQVSTVQFFSDFNIMVIICGYHWEKFVCTGKYIKPINYKFQKTTDVLCKKIFPEKTHNHISSPQIGSPQQIKVQIPPKPNLVSQWSFTGIAYRNMGEQLQKQKWLKKSILLKPSPTLVISPKS